MSMQTILPVLLICLAIVPFRMLMGTIQGADRTGLPRMRTSDLVVGGLFAVTGLAWCYYFLTVNVISLIDTSDFLFARSKDLANLVGLVLFVMSLRRWWLGVLILTVSFSLFWAGVGETDGAAVEISVIAWQVVLVTLIAFRVLGYRLHDAPPQPPWLTCPAG
jgi:hypothetical protein